MTIMGTAGRLAALLAASIAVAAIDMPPAAAGDALSAQQQRPRIVVRPRHGYLSPNAKRYCQAWLAKEYRVSGTVIVPRMRCWWQ